LGLLVLGLAAYFGRGWLRPPLTDQQQIEAQILKAAAAASSHQPRTLLSLVADDYYDGTYTKADLANLARAGLAPGGRDLRVAPYLKSLQIEGKTATTEIEAEITELSSGQSGRYQITVGWRKGRQGWQIVSAHGWEGAQSLE
jgi:hypothetical protein